ncbi:MAG: 4-phosphoerythronate dehydrogenase [Bacteroidales bacterium]|nr:4-phosphoerythronate dehydrogenase [Bacteroidales bacterium]
MKIIADHKIPFLKGALEGCCEVVYLPGKEINRKVLLDADALIVRTRTLCYEELLKDTSVKFVASATIGFDHIDTAYCEKNGISWTNAPGCNADSVKQYLASTLALIINQKKAKFSDLTLGIVGSGHVGSRVQALAKALGIKTLVNDPPRARKEGSEGFVSLEKILTEADIITLHVPLQKTGLDRTLHMADSGFFTKMKRNAWLINTSRGAVIETQSVLNSLKTGHLAGAIIDVWENEPDISNELLHQAVIATPHIAGYSSDGKANGTIMSVQAISRFFGLGLDSWTPAFLPEPKYANFTLDCQNIAPEEFFYRLALHTYDIEADSFHLKESAETFEIQRENYPVRREPGAFTLSLKNHPDGYLQIARNLGFMIQE